MKEQRDAVQEFRDAADRFVAEVGGVTDAQWRFRPAPDVWSMSHVVEHVAKANDNLLRVLSGRLLGSPIDAGSRAVIDAEIPYLFYRGDEPPNAARPGGDWTDREAACVSVHESSQRILAWSDGVALDLRSVGVSHPMFGLMDGVQWVLFGAAHLERHRAQLVGLKRNPGFPAR